MRYRGLMVASISTILAMCSIAAVALFRLPAEAQLVVHWGLDGRPDRFADAHYALFAPPVIAALLSGLMAALPSLDPMQKDLEASAPLYRTAWFGLLLVMFTVECMIAAPVFGIVLSSSSMLVAAGMLLIIIGNVLPKSRPSFFAGIRTPWTLSDTATWIATHRYASRLMIGAGLGLVLIALLPLDGEARTSFIVALMLLITVTPVLYSLLFWRRANKREG